MFNEEDFLMINSWNSKMKSLYPSGAFCVSGKKKLFEKILKRKKPNQQMLKVWFGIMNEDAKKSRALSYSEIDKRLEKLLEKGYRMVKSSAITPVGEYKYNTSVNNDEPNAANLFFEIKPNFQEFIDIYKKFGSYENNFPDYFKSYEDFKKTSENSDIILIEDIRTNKPVGFALRNIVEANSSEAQEYKDDYNFIIKDKLLYNDALVLSSEVQGGGIGRDIVDIMDGYYLQYFGDKIDYALVTGEINTNEKGQLSKDFHEKVRGFGNWYEWEAPAEKYINRFKPIKEEAKKYNKDTGKSYADKHVSTQKSYIHSFVPDRFYRN